MAKQKSQQVVIKQVRSTAGRDKRTRATLSALGLGRIGKEKTITVNPATVGMIKSVIHLVDVREVA